MTAGPPRCTAQRYPCRPQEVEKPRDEVTVQLKWIHQAQFAGMYAAAKKGFYVEED
ncbi:MAG: myristoyl transferase, partial [Ardenticatenales bacterium]|nr:myristoyl transferase [Ardenticatenales bacterium]